MLPSGGFEAGVTGWRSQHHTRARLVHEGARTGTSALRIVLTAASSSGAYSSIPRERLQDAGLVGTVTGALQGRFTASAWVRGVRRSVGRRARLQLNETGGAHGDEVLGGRAVRAVTLTRRWRRVVVEWSARRVDRTGLAVLVAVNRGRKGDSLLLDDVRMTGLPPSGNPADATSARWSWWSYALVWAVVAASGAVWLVRRRKPVGRPQT